MANMINSNTNISQESTFKQEICNAAAEKSSAGSFEQHKEVANDAAVMAASKSSDFAKATEKLEESSSNSSAGSSSSNEGGFIASAMETISGAFETAKEFVQDKVEQLKEGMHHESQPETVPIAPIQEGLSSEFKCELKQAAEAMQSSDVYAFEQHKEVANDAAVMAASKSSDFAKATEKLDASPEPSRKEIAKEKISETKQAMGENWDHSKKEGMKKMEGTMESMKEKASEVMEKVADKMKDVSEALGEKADQTKANAQHKKAEAQLGKQKASLKSVN